MTSTNGNGRTALIHGCGSTLGKAVALELASRNVRLALQERGKASPFLLEIQNEVEAAGGKASPLESPAGGNEESLISAAVNQLGHLDILVNLFVPQAEMNPEEIPAYSISLLARCLAAAKAMSSSGKQGAIVNHCFLPSMYAGTKFDDHMPEIKGSITGVTRTLCRQFGKQGIRVNCVQTGLLDMPETRAIASAEVLRVKVPVGRWGKASEVAKLIAFLALENCYISGQALIMDGGLTAGITGT